MVGYLSAVLAELLCHLHKGSAAEARAGACEALPRRPLTLVTRP